MTEEVATTADFYNISGLLTENTTHPPILLGRTSVFIYILQKAYLITPVICVTGVVGNTLSLFVFLSKPLRRTSCSWYLAARSVSDGGYLLGAFLIWLSDTSKLHFFHLHGLCQLMVFMNDFFAFLSVWLTVVVTIENYIRICRPFSVQTFCNVIIARRTIVLLLLVGLACYNYAFWTNQVFDEPIAQNITQPICSGNNNYFLVLKWLSFADMMVTFAIPCLLIITLMIAITLSLIKSLKRQSRLQSRGRSNGQAGGTGRSTSSSSSPQAKVTRMLFAVSFFFIVLNGPFHMIRMKRAIVEMLNSTRSLQPSVEEQIHVVFGFILHMSFAVNLVIYLTCGDNFRKQFKEAYFPFCIRHRSPKNCSEVTAMSVIKMEETEVRNENQVGLLGTPVCAEAEDKHESQEGLLNSPRGQEFEDKL